MTNLRNVVCALAVVTSTQVSASLEVTCNVIAQKNEVGIQFAGIKGEFNPSDYGEKGRLSVTATVRGNGNERSFSGQTKYEKVGNRLEIRDRGVQVAGTFEQFQEFFGTYPEVTCVSP